MQIDDEYLVDGPFEPTGNHDAAAGNGSFSRSQLCHFETDAECYLLGQIESQGPNNVTGHGEKPLHLQFQINVA